MRVTKPVIVEARGIYKRFGGVEAIRGVDLQVKQDEVVGIIGPNGAGKTTLFSILSGFERPTSGQVFYRNMQINGLPPHRVSRMGIVRTFQIPRPFVGLTVLESVMVGAFSSKKKTAEAREAALEVLEFTGLIGKKDRPAKEITYAERKCLEFSRALAMNPSVLLIDEIAAGLNATEKRNLADIVKKVALRGVTIIAVEHDMEFILSLAHRVVVLFHGEKLMEGSPHDVFRNNKVIDAYMGVRGANAQVI